MSKTIVYIRNYLSRLLVIVGILSILISYYFVPSPVDRISGELTTWNTNINTFSLFVGLLTVYSGYLDNVLKRGRYWQYHVYSMVLIVVWIIWGVSTGVYTVTYQNVYVKLKGNLSVAMLGQLGFFIMSGAYRTFRMRNYRTALFAICCVTLGMLNMSFISNAFPDLQYLTAWLLENPAAAGSRAIVITNGLGAIVLGLRILIGLEKGALRMIEEVG
jgi:hypothetical protein